ncbi:hypothetical protein ACFV0C_12680 [Streptomyces sp. NPDC059568]
MPNTPPSWSRRPKEVIEDARRVEKFNPPLYWRELAFYDAVADHGTA